MLRRWSKVLVFATLLGTGAHVGAQSPAPASPLATSITAALAGVNLGATVRVGLVVLEASSGRVVFAQNPDLALNPASNAKVLTAATALTVLGPDRRFTTALYGTPAPGSVLGPLVLRGQGDPSLDTGDLYELAREVAAQGIRRVDGDLVVDDSAFGSQHLPPAFEQQPRETAAFRAAVGAVSVNENAIALRVRPGGVVGGPAIVTVEPRGYLEVENAMTTSDGGAPVVNLEVTPLPDGREHARVTGSFPATARMAVYHRRLDNPGLAAGWAMRAALEDLGVRVTGTVRVGTASSATMVQLCAHRSAPLSSLLYEVGKDSNNFFAEMTLLAIAAHQGATPTPGPVTFQRGIDRVSAWARDNGVPAQGLVVRNGSGLFDANRISARQLASVHRGVWRLPSIRDEFIAQLAVGGDDGTLHGRLRIENAERVVRAKTGTLDDAISLSGFVLAADPARTLVFAFMANGVRGRGGVARQAADAVVTQLVMSVR